MFAFKLRRKCIICNKYHKFSDMAFIYRGIGVCEECYGSIKTSGDKSFASEPPVDFVLSAFDYDGGIRRAVVNYKFAGQKAYGHLFGKMICAELSNHDIFRDFDCVIPIPLHAKRLMERGYNQSEIIAEEIADNFGLPCYKDVVFRIRETKRQSELKAMDRIENVKSAFYGAESVVSGKNIILVDDIYTMGQTMSSCATALKQAGAGKIIGITLCKTCFKEKPIYLR